MSNMSVYELFGETQESQMVEVFFFCQSRITFQKNASSKETNLKPSLAMRWQRTVSHLSQTATATPLG